MPKRKIAVRDMASLFDEGRIIVWRLEYPSWIASVYGAEHAESLLWGGEEATATFNWGTYLRENCHPDDLERVAAEIEEALENGGSYSSEYRTWDREHECWRFWHAFGRARKMPGGTMYIFGGLQDIGEHMPRRQPVQDKIKTADCARAILDATPLCCNFWSPDCRNIDCNQEVIKLFGLSDKQEYLERFDDLSPVYQPCGRLSSELVAEKVRSAFSTGYERFEWMHQKLDGEPIPTDITLVRVQNGDGYIVAGYTHDMRDFKAMQDRTRAADERTRIMLDAMPLCCNFWNSEYENIDCNQEAANLFGLSGKQEYLDRFAELSPTYQPCGRLSSEMSHEKITGAFEKGYERFEWMHQKLNGEQIPAEITLVRVKYGDGYIVAGYTRDLRELKAMLARMHKTQEELRVARDLAEDSARAKSEFLANMSHEIRTPMNAILGMTHLVLQTDVTDRQRYYLDKVKQSAKLLLRIINDILDFSKIDAGKLEMQKTVFSIDDVLRDVSDLVIDEASEKGLSVTINADPSIPPALVGDPLRVTQVLLNLISNSIKFTQAGRVEVSVSLADRNEAVCRLLFSVKDTGIGMTKEQVNGLFCPFSQADNSTTRKYGGTGLGLVICKSLIQLMSGTIWCESKSDVGSSFYFSVEFAIPPTDSDSEQPALPPLNTILIGDDDSAFAPVRMYLNILRCPVINAFYGMDSIYAMDESLRTQDANIQLIVMDFNDVAAHGAAAYSKLLEIFGDDLPPVLFAATNKSIAALKSFAGGRSGVFYKPTTLSTLYDGIINLISYEEDTGVREAPPEAAPMDIANGAHILLVEDNEINQILAVELLKARGFEVDVAGNGREALDLMSGDRHYDLVLMDIQMPEMDGLAAARAIRSDERFSELPIIAMTAHAMSGDRELSLEAGMNDHVTKPIDPDVLYDTLQKWLHRA